MTEPMRFLILEDNPADAELVQFELEEAGLVFTSKVVMTEEGFVRDLQEFQPDLILSDYDLPKYNGALALAEAKRRRPDTPFILVTGAVTEDRAIDILTQGAKDYVLKNRLQQRLVPAVRRALAEAEEHRARKQAEAELREAHRTLEERVKTRTAELEAEMAVRKKTEEALRLSDRRYSALFANKINGMTHCRIITDEHGRPVDYCVLQINEAYERIIGIKKADIEGRRVKEVFPGIENYAFDYIGVYGKIALEGGEIKFEEFFEATRQYLSIYAYSPLPGEFAAIFTDITERKLAEEKLQASEERYRGVVENTTAIVLRVDPSGVITFANSRALEFFGYTADELIGSHAVGTIVPARESTGRDLAAMVDQITADPDRFHSNANENICRDGRRVWLEWTNSGVYGADGCLKEFLSVGIDATAHKQVEEALRNQAELMDHSSEALITREMGGIIRSWNRGAERLYGWAAAEAVGQHSHALLRTPSSSVQTMETALGQTGHWEGELLHTTRDGRSVTVESRKTAIHTEDGTLLILESNRDITARKRAERELKKSEERFRSIFRSNVIALAIWDAQGHLLDANDRFLKLIGYTREAFHAGQVRWDEATPPEMRQRDYDAVKELQAGKDVEPYEKAFVHPDGTRVPVIIGGSILPGTPDVGVAFAVDITLRKRAEEEMRAAVQELEEFNQAMVGRELRMVELKQEINALCAQLGQPPRYPLDDEEAPR